MIRYSLLFSESLDNFFLKKDDEEKIRNISLGKNFFLQVNAEKRIENYFFEDNRLGFIILDGLIYNIENNSHKEYLSKLFYIIEEKGFDQMIRSLDGDFSIVYYSKKAHKIYFGRDNFGVKPCYYRLNAKSLIVASQPSQIINLGLAKNIVNKKYLFRYAGLHYRFIDNYPDESPYAEISQVPAAHYLKVDLVSMKKFKVKYWKLENISLSNDGNIHTLREKYYDLLRKSVQSRITTNQKKVFSISGGLDSSTVLSLAEKILQEKVESYSVTYEDEEFDEKNEILEITNIKAKTWHEIKLDNKVELENKLTQIIAINDEPLATSTWFSHFIALEKIKTFGYDLIFGGLGGDEFNAGEYEYFTFFFADIIKNGQNFDQEVGFWEKYHNHKIYKKNKSVALENLKNFVDFNVPGKCLIDKTRVTKYVDCIQTENFAQKNYEDQLFCPFESYLNNRTYQDLFYETLPCCLRAQDRNGNFFGLHTVNPFLQKDIAEFMFSIPHSLKIKKGVTKFLLREATKETLPETTRNRITKVGWNAPAHLWFTGKNLDFVRDELNSKNFKNLGLYNIKNTNKIIDDHLKIIKKKSIKENHMMFLWQLTNILIWSKTANIRL